MEKFIRTFLVCAVITALSISGCVMFNPVMHEDTPVEATDE